MSSREKRLLLLLSSALLVVVSLFGFNAIQDKRNKEKTLITKYEGILDLADVALSQQESIEDEAIWLEENLPEPREAETMPSQLESFTTTQATRAGLTVTRPKILPNDEGGLHFQRARFQIAVTGSEASLYRWLNQLQNPKDFRSVTSIRLTPNREDDTQIDATVQVEQWFIPLVEGEFSEDPSTAATNS